MAKAKAKAEDGPYKFAVGDVVRHRADQRVKAGDDGKRWVFVVTQRYWYPHSNANASKSGYRIAYWSCRGSWESVDVTEAELELVAKYGGEP